MVEESVNAPQQSRSKQSFARVKLAAISLLEERGSQDFTIAEVSEASGLAVGSIYGRVGNKAALIRLVQDEELTRIEAEISSAVSSSPLRGELREDLRGIVGPYVEVLRSNADFLRASMRAAMSDEAAERRGAESGVRGRELFIQALGKALDLNGISASLETLDWVTEVVYSVATRQFGIGTLTPKAPAELFPMDELKAQLADTVYVMLTASTRT